MGANGHLHASAALPPGQKPVVPTGGGWIGPRACLDVMARRRTPAFAGNWSLIVQSIV